MRRVECGHRLLLRSNSIKMAKIYGNLYLHFMETKRCFSVSLSHPIPFIRHSCAVHLGYTLFSNSNCCVQLTHIFIIFLLLHWNYAVDRHFCCVRVCSFFSFAGKSNLYRKFVARFFFSRNLFSVGK